MLNVFFLGLLHFGCGARKTISSAEEDLSEEAQGSEYTESEGQKTLQKSSSEAKKQEEKVSGDALTCVESCIQDRRAEAVSAQLIEQQCLDGCARGSDLPLNQKNIIQKKEVQQAETPQKEED